MLLDTCTFLWLAEENSCVPARVLRTLERHEGPVYLSVVSMWEIAAKYSRGHLELGAAPSRWVPEVRARFNVESLGLSEGVAGIVEALPWHHKDPFDRMLIASAIGHGLVLVSPDEHMSKYPIRTLW